VNPLARKSRTTAAAAAVLASLIIASAPALAEIPTAGVSKAHAASASHAPAALSPSQLAAEPLTTRNLTKQEIANLAVVLSAYHDAEGGHLHVNAFINSFSKNGVFHDMVAAKTYKGKALGDVLTGMQAIFPNVHRQLYKITVNPNEISVELAIQGTFEGPLHTPVGTVKPNRAKVSVPTADFWYLKDGKITKFDCYVGYSDMYAQMGVKTDWAGAVANG
jgi:hypothetical protein